MLILLNMNISCVRAIVYMHQREYCGRRKALPLNVAKTFTGATQAVEEERLEKSQPWLTCQGDNNVDKGK